MEERIQFNKRTLQDMAFFVCIILSCFGRVVSNNSYAEHLLSFRGHLQAPFKCNN